MREHASLQPNHAQQFWPRRHGRGLHLSSRRGAYLCPREHWPGRAGAEWAALARLGEAFFRVKTPQTAQITGTGLGLSICKQIIAAHEGHLEVESEEGKGSTFRVLLPRKGAVG